MLNILIWLVRITFYPSLFTFYKIKIESPEDKEDARELGAAVEGISQLMLNISGVALDKSNSSDYSPLKTKADTSCTKELGKVLPKLSNIVLGVSNVAQPGLLHERERDRHRKNHDRNDSANISTPHHKEEESCDNIHRKRPFSVQLRHNKTENNPSHISIPKSTKRMTSNSSHSSNGDSIEKVN